MEYSAVIQPPVTSCSFIQRGTDSSTVTPQITRVLPHSTSVEPVAYGAMPLMNRRGQSCSGIRPSPRTAMVVARVVSGISSAMLNQTPPPATPKLEIATARPPVKQSPKSHTAKSGRPGTKQLEVKL